MQRAYPGRDSFCLMYCTSGRPPSAIGRPVLGHDLVQGKIDATGSGLHGIKVELEGRVAPILLQLETCGLNSTVLHQTHMVWGLGS